MAPTLSDTVPSSFHDPLAIILDSIHRHNSAWTTLSSREARNSLDNAFLMPA